ncbi:MAG: AgmX/PglI C-terminal domain-containing protein [Myxococcaceae bacterium]
METARDPARPGSPGGGASFFRGDDGAPVDGDRVLALVLRWADRPLTLEHVRVGQLARPLDGVELKWEGALPIFALADGTRARVEREGRSLEGGRRVALENGDLLVVESGQLTLEARVQKRSERLAPGGRQGELFFGLVLAHALMFFAAISTALVITPRTDDETIFGGPVSVLRAAVTPFLPAPKRVEPQLEQRVNEKVAERLVAMQATPTPQRKSTASDALRLLLGGGGGNGLFGRGLGQGIDTALNALGSGGDSAGAGNGVGGHDLGASVGGPGPGLGNIGPLGVGPPGGLVEFKSGRKPPMSPLCTGCELKAPGYDRDLVLKVVRAHQHEIRFCYESGLSQNPELNGKVTVAWTIDGTGGVSIAEIAESGLSNKKVEDCIVSRISRWKFPEPKGGQEVAITFPWVFSVAGSD